MVNIAKVTVDPSKVEEYKLILKEEMETSLRLEADVYVLYAVSDNAHPNEFTILEVYKDQEAYNRHCRMPQMQKYFAETKGIVQKLEISEVTPVIPGIRMK